MKFIDIFAGAGGFGLGFHMAGYEMILSLEKDEWACDTLIRNHGVNKILHSDIKQFTAFDNIQEQPDIIIGGPPCQGFSVAGPTQDPNDPRNTLFTSYVQWVKELKPKVFVMENVKGILSRKTAEGRSIISIIQQAFDEIGYDSQVWVLKASDYGVPQIRERVFIIGNRLGLKFQKPKQTHSLSSKDGHLISAINVHDAISDLPFIEARQGESVQLYDKEPISDYQIWARKGSNYVFNHQAMKHTKRLVDRFRMIQNGTNIQDLPDEYRVRQRNGNGDLSNSHFQSNYRHLKPEMVSYTIPASFYSSFIHPSIPRNITAREAARIQSFPDHYIFEGKRTLISKKLLKRLGKDYSERLSQYNQIGNAVPPLLAKAIASQIKLELSAPSSIDVIRGNVEKTGLLVKS